MPPQKPENDNHSSWFLVCLGVLLLLIFGSVVYIPDSYEHYILSDCLDGQSFVDCDHINLGFRPPLMAFFLLPFGFAGVSILSMISIAGTATITQKLGKSYVIWFAFLALFCTHRYPIIADARTFLLIFVFGAWIWMMQLSSVRSAILCGITIGATMWIRPEAQLGIILFLGTAWFWQRQYFKWLTLGTLCMACGWIGWLSWHAGQWVWAPRYWEGYMLESWSVMPKRAMLQLGGMGLYNPPLREIWLQSPPMPPKVTPQLHTIFPWFLEVWKQSPLIWLGGILSAPYLYTKKPRIVVLLLSIGSINVIAALLPQARDPAFVESNFLLTKSALVILIALACSHKHTWLGYLAPLTLMLLDPKPVLEESIESTEVGKQAVAWIAKQETADIPFVSSYESAAIVWLAKKDWRQWDDPWHRTPSPKYVLVSNLDVFAVGLPLCTKQKMEVHFSQAHTFVSIYSCAVE